MNPFEFNTTSGHGLGRLPLLSALLAVFLACGLPVRAATLTVELGQRGGPLKKAGLGSLFGVVTNASPAWKFYMTNSHRFVSEHQPRIGEGTSVFPSTAAVAPVIRNTGVRMICRFGDLCYGWEPYTWPGLDNSWLAPGAAHSWLEQVTNAANDIKNNYLDVVECIALFNEPDGQLKDANFYNDPNIAGGTQAQRINHVWTRTYQVIRSILPTVKIMGPNYVDYRPQYFPAHQTLMRDFLTNAIATGTVPDIIGWHSLYDGNPAGLRVALKDYYRPLEATLGVPGAPLPMACEEYGINNGAFEGIPGQMVRYWAEFERAGVDIACMGIYENGGDLGNTMRYTFWDEAPQPNAGWYMMNWYLSMQGEYVPVTANGIDGLASWDAAGQALTVLFGGSDGATTVQVKGLGALGLGNAVRVRLDQARWTTNQHVAVDKVSMGGDPQSGPYNLYDRQFNLDAAGNLSIPASAVEGAYHGYRLLVTAAGAPETYPTKYEAESATVQHAIHYSTGQASAGSYIGGIDFADSFVCFHVTAPSNGLYNMLVRYAASQAYGPASQFVTVNGQEQGMIAYPPTAGWAGTELRTTSRLVSLVKGVNDIVLSHGTNYAELDFIDVRPDIHRYDAELATNAHVRLGSFNTCYVPNCVGGIDYADSLVRFAVTVPVAGTYQLTAAYANGTANSSTHVVRINGSIVGALSYAPSGGWLGGGWLSGANPNKVRKFSSLLVTLDAGLNQIELGKGNGYAELDYVRISGGNNLTSSIPKLGIALTNGASVAVSWPMPAERYILQQSAMAASGAWSVVSNDVTVVGNHGQVILPAASAAAFYRLFP